MDHMSFTCALQSNGACIDPGTGAQYECTAGSYFDNNTKCMVAGRQVLYVTQGIGHKRSFWTSFGYMLCILACFKIGIYILTLYPWERIVYHVRMWTDSTTHESHQAILASTRAQIKESKKIAKGAEADGSVALAVLPVDDVTTTDAREERVSGSTPALTWTHMSVVLPKKKTVLIDNVSGMVKCGRVLALMGPSGAGKTTYVQSLTMYIIGKSNN